MRSFYRILLTAGLSLLVLSLPGRGQENPQKSELAAPKTEEIEKQLVYWVNQARSQAKLNPLGTSQALQDLARSHSRELAKTRELTHVSISGQSYTDRLVSAQIYFAEHGENVAFSETYVAEFIHQSLMESPEHRANILDRNFNRLGIGVVQVPDRGYYVTQDFIRSLEMDDSPDSEQHSEETSEHFEVSNPELLLRITQKAQELVQSLRREKNLPKFEFREDANSLARKFAERRAQNRPLPPLSPPFQKIHLQYLILTGPTLEKIEPLLSLFKSATIRSGGIGVSFTRDEKFPGGTFVFVFLLFMQPDYSDMSRDERTGLVLKQIQQLRSRDGLSQLTIDPELSERGSEISKAMLDKERRQYPISEELLQYRIESYITFNPSQFPENVASSLRRPSLRRLGVGVAFRPDSGLPSGSFCVTLIYR